MTRRTLLMTGTIWLGLARRPAVSAARTAITGTVRSRAGQPLAGLALLERGEIHNNVWHRGALVDAGGMKVLDNPIELALVLGELIRDPATARAAGARAKAAVECGRGALEATLRLVEDEVLKGR